VTRLRFLLDEHIDWGIQRGLLRLAAEMDVLAVGQPLAPPKATPDPDILRWIERTGYVLVTQNRRTIPEYLTAHYAAGGQVPGPQVTIDRTYKLEWPVGTRFCVENLPEPAGG